MKQPNIGIIMGSDSDLPVMQETAKRNPRVKSLGNVWAGTRVELLCDEKNEKGMTDEK